MLPLSDVLALAGTQSRYRRGPRPAGFLAGLWHGIVLLVVGSFSRRGASVHFGKSSLEGKNYGMRRPSATAVDVRLPGCWPKQTRAADRHCQVASRFPSLGTGVCPIAS